MSAIYAIIQVEQRTGGPHPRCWGSGPSQQLLMAAFVALEARIENPDHAALRILRLRGLQSTRAWSEAVLVTGMYSTFFLGTLYLEHAPPLQRPAKPAPAFLPWTLTVAVLSQGVTARLVDRFGPLHVLTAGMASAPSGGCSLFATAGPDTGFFPTVFFASFLIGLGIGNAFMPLLTPGHGRCAGGRCRARLRESPMSPQQISGALGLAVLSTLADNHTKGLLGRPPQGSPTH